MSNSEMIDLLLDLVKEIREDGKETKRHLTDIKITQAEQAIILVEHQKCSQSNGDRLTHLEDEVIPRICEKIAPKPVNWKKLISWGLGVLVSISTIVITFWKVGLI